MNLRSPWTRRLTAGVCGAAALVMTTAMAYAAWSASGLGAGSAKAGTTAALSASADVPTALYPGSTSDLTVKVNNPNGFAASVTALDFGAVSAANGCSTGGITVSSAGMSLPRPVPANGSLTLTASISMSTSTPNACQGTTFSVPVTATGRVS